MNKPIKAIFDFYIWVNHDAPTWASVVVALCTLGLGIMFLSLLAVLVVIGHPIISLGLLTIPLCIGFWAAIAEYQRDRKQQND